MSVPREDSLPSLPSDEEITRRILERSQVTPDGYLERAHLNLVMRDRELETAITSARNGHFDLAERAIRRWCESNTAAREYIEWARSDTKRSVGRGREAER